MTTLTMTDKTITPPTSWRAIDQLTDNNCIFEIYDWLSFDGSLTKRLRGELGDQFQLKLLHQHWFEDDNGRKLLCREVAMLNDEQLIVMAKSIFPKTTLQGEEATLEFLGNRSLGDYLFTHEGVVRSPIEVCYGDMNHEFSTETLELNNLPKETWARRSIFTLNHKPLSVLEVFTPEFWQSLYAAV